MLNLQQFVCLFTKDIVVQTNSTQSAKICPNLQFRSGMVQTNSTQSAKICPNLQFRSGDGPDQLNPKCQDLSKSGISGMGEEGWWFRQHSWNTWVGALKEFWAQIFPCHTLEALALQIVSHTLRVWRLIREFFNNPYSIIVKRIYIDVKWSFGNNPMGAFKLNWILGMQRLKTLRSWASHPVKLLSLHLI